ncbi:hypothetical protein EX30DRAFT_364061 [Ascodesmis nigricans]|uniref:Uncharacterized protein n=1 Tax=Ascodesmis nigricans TaxID=341454 RepID=A0A4S2MWI3_9PEZI|nr:hypothetical protein EX30DRAFT_364061 [Ascodesmis nigricans]
MSNTGFDNLNSDLHDALPEPDNPPETFQFIPPSTTGRQPFNFSKSKSESASAQKRVELCAMMALALEICIHVVHRLPFSVNEDHDHLLERIKAKSLIMDFYVFEMTSPSSHLCASILGSEELAQKLGTALCRLSYCLSLGGPGNRFTQLSSQGYDFHGKESEKELANFKFQEAAEPLDRVVTEFLKLDFLFLTDESLILNRDDDPDKMTLRYIQDFLDGISKHIVSLVEADFKAITTTESQTAVQAVHGLMACMQGIYLLSEYFGEEELSMSKELKAYLKQGKRGESDWNPGWFVGQLHMSLYQFHHFYSSTGTLEHFRILDLGSEDATAEKKKTYWKDSRSQSTTPVPEEPTTPILLYWQAYAATFDVLTCLILFTSRVVSPNASAHSYHTFAQTLFSVRENLKITECISRGCSEPALLDEPLKETAREHRLPKVLGYEVEEVVEDYLGRFMGEATDTLCDQITWVLSVKDELAALEEDVEMKME